MMVHAREWCRLGAALSVAIWAFACSGVGNDGSGSSGKTSGSGGDGGQAQASSSSSTTTSSSSTGGMAGGGGAGGGSMAFKCDPPAEPGSLYEISAKTYDINDLEPISLCKYRGDVLLIVNTAAA